MEKISGIIKSSPRVQAVDMRESSPIRPGTPTFGRPEGVSSLAKSALDADLTAGSNKRVAAAQEELSGWKAKDQKMASIAAELTNKFFSRPTSSVGDELAPAGLSESSPSNLPMSVADRPSILSGFKTDSVGTFRTNINTPSRAMNFNPITDDTPMVAQPEGLFPRGSFIDRIA